MKSTTTLTALKRIPSACSRLKNASRRSLNYHAKHRVNADQLVETLESLDAELKELDDGGESIDSLQARQDRLAALYSQQSAQLTALRSKAAVTMAAEINQQLQLLSMQGAELVVSLTPAADGELRASGGEDIEFSDFH